MGREVDLLVNFPRTKRNIDERAVSKSEEDIAIARRFDKDFFDGDRRHGYGGHHYNSRFWQPVAPTFKEHWSLNYQSSILDVGCAKGFMLHDFLELIPGMRVEGIDVSEYAIANSLESVKPFLQVADCRNLPYADNSFDYVISINTVHNLDLEECAQSLREIERISRLGSFITVDAYRNEEEKRRMFDWKLTAKTILSVDEWVVFFGESGYTGDYYWFIP